MPWKECSVMDERPRFVARLLDGEAMSEVCRAFGISRKTGYKIFDRYKEHGLEALTDRSRRPVRYANQLPRQIESLRGPKSLNGRSGPTPILRSLPLARRSAGTTRQIIKANAEPVKVDYLMRRNGEAWLIADIYFDGAISEVATRRSEFAAISRSQGIDGLIAASTAEPTCYRNHRQGVLGCSLRPRAPNPPRGQHHRRWL
jgi:transposase-like protein